MDIPVPSFVSYRTSKYRRRRTPDGFGCTSTSEARDQRVVLGCTSPLGESSTLDSCYLAPSFELGACCTIASTQSDLCFGWQPSGFATFIFVRCETVLVVVCAAYTYFFAFRCPLCCGSELFLGLWGVSVFLSGTSRPKVMDKNSLIGLSVERDDVCDLRLRSLFSYGLAES